jgi:hypothetical protein
MRVVAGILYVLGPGPACGGGMMEPADAAPSPDAVCAVPAGRAYILSRLAITAAEGFDLDADGDVDNELGQLPDATLASVNGGLADYFAMGTFLVVGLITDWSDPPTADDPDVAFHILHVFDADRDPANNFDGEGEFRVHQDAFDLSCGLATRADETRLEASVLRASRSSWIFELSSGGQLQLDRATLVGSFDAGFERATGRIGAVLPYCTLSALPVPGAISGTVLDALVNDPGLAGTVAPDLDVDGDGLERIVGDGVGIDHCVDGNGEIVAGRTCPCHPAIVDGYSVGLEHDIVLGRLVGVI